MRLLLREYVALLRESGELDVLVPDLFLAMGLEPLTKAQVGVGQHGVDASAVGTDPETGERTLFLATIKPGDVSRANWDAGKTGVRASLNEILDVYHQRRLPAAHQDLPVRILLVCGGDLKQNAEDNWNGFVSRYSEPGISFDFWGGERLAILVETHLLDEHLFPPDAQGLMRKALALLDQNEEAPVFFYQLVSQILADDPSFSGSTGGAPARRVKALRLLALCLGVVLHWAVDVENTRPAVLAAERAVLRAWDFLRVHEAFDHKPSVEAFSGIYSVYLAALQAYAVRVQPLCLVQDGLSGYAGRAEPIEYPLRTFEVLGILATLGLNHAFLYLATEGERDGRIAGAAAETLEALIENNPAASTPLYDDHAVELALGTALLSMMHRMGSAGDWLVKIGSRLVVAFQVGKFFPVATDRYEDLLALERGDADVDDLQSMSTLIPVVAEWLAALGRDDDYADLSRATRDGFSGTTLQLWFPDDDTDDYLYRSHAARETGAMFSPLFLPETADEARVRMQTLREAHDAFDRFSCVMRGFPMLGFVASRHFRTPVAPAYWQRVSTLHQEGKATPPGPDIRPPEEPSPLGDPGPR